MTVNKARSDQRNRPGGTPLPGLIPINKGLRSKHPMGYRRSIPNESRFFAVITICWDEHRYFRFDPNILGSLPPKKQNAADGNFRCGISKNIIAKKRRIVKR